jgi:hypothetical protein
MARRSKPHALDDLNRSRTPLIVCGPQKHAAPVFGAAE